jgi:hypothetical protein
MYRLHVRRSSISVAVAALLCVTFANGAAAMPSSTTTPAAPIAPTDGVHLLQTVWMGGCTVDFSLEPLANAEYEVNVVNGLGAIAHVTGITFNQVGDLDPRADVRYGVVESLPENATGMATSMGDVSLLPVNLMPDAHNEDLNNDMRDRIVAHETLHVLGLDHDDEAWSRSPDELMNPTQPWTPLEFGAGDLAGMAYLRRVNQCVQPPVSSPPPLPTIDPSIAASPAASRAGSGSRPTGSGTTSDESESAQSESTPGRESSASGGCGSGSNRRTDGSEGTCAPPRHDRPSEPPRHEEPKDPPKHEEPKDPPKQEEHRDQPDPGARGHSHSDRDEH